MASVLATQPSTQDTDPHLKSPRGHPQTCNSKELFYLSSKSLQRQEKMPTHWRPPSLVHTLPSFPVYLQFKQFGKSSGLQEGSQMTGRPT